ncbi:MAG: c-type cytochrome [Chloroflexi bacterium]|nr:c-type cytochrome [Chloroflexota bacterium]
MRGRAKPQPPQDTFWPTHIFKEAVVTLIIFAVLVTLAVLFPPAHESTARPMDTSYVPRPEWYFLFLFKTLEFFPGELEVVGAIVVPGLAVMVLVLLPFFDRSQKMGFIKRPLASAIGLFVIGAVAFLTIEGMAGVPPSLTARAEFIELGEILYQKQGCASCHAINGTGGTIGPDLAGLSERRTLSWVHKYLEDPLSTKPDSAMPGYLGTISHEEVEAVSLYIMSLMKAPAEGTPQEAPPATSVPSQEATPTAPPPSQEAAPVASAPPQVPHTLEGRSTCLACHQTGIGGAPAVPANHAGRTNDICLACHKGKE